MRVYERDPYILSIERSKVHSPSSYETCRENRMTHIVWLYRKKDGYCSPVLVKNAKSRSGSRKVVLDLISRNEVEDGRIVSIAEVKDENGR